MFDYETQVSMIKKMLQIVDQEKDSVQGLEAILEFAELIKKYSDKNNAHIYDMTEYVYELIRTINKEPGSMNPQDLREKLNSVI